MLQNVHLFSLHLYSCFSPRKNSSFADIEELEDLASTLTSEESDFDQWMASKNEIKDFISKHSEDLEELDDFFSTLIVWGIERNPQKTIAFLADLVSLEILMNVVENKLKKTGEPFDDIFEKAAKKASKFPKPVDNSFHGHLFSEWKKSRHAVIYFIPNLINICLGAFNFLDTYKKFTTIWEKYLLLEIIYKLFVVPYCLVKVLEPIFGKTAKVYLVAATIILAVGILISCYHRWLRPMPDEIVNCTNLDKQMEMGILDPKVGQTKEIDRLIAALEVDANVLLIGRSGEGKTALVHHFIQLKQEGKLPEKLQNLTVQELKCGLMISSQSFGHSELITQTRDQIKGYEDHILFFFDEFQQIVANPSAFQAFKKEFLEDKPRAKFIAAITYTEWEELKKLDKDYSFRRRICRIRIDSPKDKQVKKMLHIFKNRFAQDVPIKKNAIEAMIKISAEKDYLPEIGRAAKAEELFTTAVGICRAAYHHHYVSVKLSKAEKKANQKQIQKIKKIVAHQQKINSDYCRLTHLFAKTIPQEDDFPEISIDRKHLEEVDLLEDKEEERISIPLLSKESISKKDQILYLWYKFYVRDLLKEMLNREISKVNPKIPIQVDSDLIYQIYEDLKEMEADPLAKDQEEKDETSEEEFLSVEEE